MATLVDAGALRKGQRLYATIADREARTSKRVEAELIDEGRVRVLSDGAGGDLNGSEFASPSAAITALIGRAESGWLNWTAEQDGKLVLLEEIRNQFDQRPTN